MNDVGLLSVCLICSIYAWLLIELPPIIQLSTNNVNPYPHHSIVFMLRITIDELR
jgi:hypothetical protein